MIRASRPGAASVALAAVLLLVTSRPGALAQEGPPSLDAVEAAADRGQLGEARGLLERWREARGDGADRAASERARLLAARLSTDPDSARTLYAGLAVSGGPDVAAEARLRLAQLRLAEGRPERALEDLELLRADHPSHPLSAASWLWTGHARRLAGDVAGACEAYRSAVRLTGDEELRGRAEGALSRCRDGPAVGRSDGTGWSVQLGAFSDASAARALARRADEAGFPARVLEPGEDGLRRVRSGRWASRADAEAAARRMAGRGFRVLIVEREEEASGGDR